MYAITEISQIVGSSKAILSHPDSEIYELIYDSRKIIQPEHALFFALIGARDGHAYISSAYRLGVRNFVVSNPDFAVETFPDANIVFVDESIRAIQSLAGYHARQFTKPIIGITGSNGKTVVKEWLYELLSPEKQVYQSPKSYNSQLGVALSLWNLTNQYDIAIIEAGISKPGEMIKLEQMIRPDIGVFTSLGVAHAEGFSSKAVKLTEKLALFDRSSVLIYPSKYIADADLIRAKQWSWGEDDHDVLRVQNLQIEKLNTALTIVETGTAYSITLPFTDLASIENSLTCIAVLRYLDFSWESIRTKVMRLKSVEMRLQLKKGIRDTSIIDDSYSNDLGSLKIALEFLNQQRQYEKKTLVLSELMGLPDDPKYLQKLVKLLNSYSFSRLIWIGEKKIELCALPVELVFFDSVDALFQHWSELYFGYETILVKGGRNFKFESIVKKLTAKSHGTVLEINLNAIEHNLKAYRSLLPSFVKLMAMVKAFSYGSGSFEVANLLQYNNVDYLTVAFVDEGVELRQGGITLPIMVLSPDASTFESLVANQLEPEIYSFSILSEFTVFLMERNLRDYPIHIKLDTGMHRLGFLPQDVPELINKLQSTDTVKVQSVFSHLVASGDPNQDEFTKMQIELFDRYATQIKDVLGYPIFKHIVNTSGIVRWSYAYFDMVRLGIGMYGVELNNANIDIVPTSALKTTITQLKSLPKSETVGYDRKGVLFKDSVIATVKIGYADGYDRRFGNGVGKMLVNQQLVPTIGNVCMDMCMLDVTGMDVKEGDSVIVFPDMVQSAKDIGVIPYELLVNISSRVKRVYYYG